MRSIIVVILLCATSFAYTQHYISHQADINFGESFRHGDIRIEFLKILSDSRCPKSVTCIRAGEAEVLVAIYKGKRRIGKKKLIFDASGVVTEQKNLLFSNDEVRIMGMGLFPYPEYPEKIADEAYTLEIKIN